MNEIMNGSIVSGTAHSLLKKIHVASQALEIALRNCQALYLKVQKWTKTVTKVNFNERYRQIDTFLLWCYGIDFAMINPIKVGLLCFRANPCSKQRKNDMQISI